MADGGGARADAPDSARIEALVADLNRGAGGQAAGDFGAGLRAKLDDGLARLRAQAAMGDLDACAGLIASARDRLAALRPQTLEPRRGIAGLFDGRGRRLKRFRAAFADARAGLLDVAVDLRRRRAETEGRQGLLEGLWADSRDAASDAAAHAAALSAWLSGRSAPEDGADPDADLRDHAPRFQDERRLALRRPALARALQNADTGLGAAIEAVAAGLDGWMEDWTQALGLDRKRPRKVRPDPAALDAGSRRLTDVLDTAERALAQARARRQEIAARLN